MQRKNPQRAPKGPAWILRLLPAATLPALVLAAGQAYGQASITGQIQGRVLNEETGQPLAGVTVVVSGPALQAEQAESTDAGGRYTVTQIPVGSDYVVRFYFNDVIVERPGVRLSQGQALNINVRMPTQKKKGDVIVVKERAPAVDTVNTDTRTEINQEILQNTAVRGRTYESVLSLAPGAVDPPRGTGGDVGVSFSGSTGNENNFLIDGLNTTDPNLGLLGTNLHQYFIKEINVITGGYQAEFGRATGGIVSILTKSGSNEFHGGVFGSWAPFQLKPTTLARLGEALGTRRRQSNEYDFGFELGGPILKDRIWFYAGFAPTFTTFTTERVIRTQTYNAMTGRANVDPNFECPAYLAYNGYCDGPRALALQTDEKDSQEITEYRRRYNWIAKLQFNLHPDHNIQLGYIGSPETFDGYGAIRSELAANKYTQTDQIHDVTARYVGKFFDRKLQLEIMYGYHRQDSETLPDAINKAAITYRASGTNPFSLADFETVDYCQRQMVADPARPGMMKAFNPCPITSYTRNGFGQYSNSTLQRHVVQTSLTYFLKLAGNHAWKLGFDFEDNVSDNFRTYTGTDLDPSNPFSGHRVYRSNASGATLQIYRAYAQQDKDGKPVELNGFRGLTETRNFSAYLRDQWNVGFLPGLVINLGVRWEGQEIYGADGNKQISIYDNWAPRVGAVYDVTRKGRSKLFVNYGRFYESIPLDLNDRQFSGEGLLNTGYAPTTGANACPKTKVTNYPTTREIPSPSSAAGAACKFPAGTVNGGQYGEVAPNLKGQYINEVTAGFQYDVGLDIVLGASYVHRDLGNIIEDMSTDGGHYYLIANPGVTADPEVVKDLQATADDLKKQAMANPMNDDLQVKAQNAQSKLDSYRAVGATFPKARRDYNAVQLSVNKRMSNRFSILANYTYSRTIGNYPGTFSASNGQLDPNISSQYDLTDLLANRNGALPTDRPHNFKLTGFYAQPIGSKGNLVASLTFTAYSGRPIEVLGFHPLYGSREVFILPRGSGGRTPAITQFDAHIAYEHQLSKLVRLNIYADLINMFNQQEVANVDDEYTASVVAPLLNGKPEDLVHLKASDGTIPIANSNYGQPTGYQLPLYMRFGARVSF